MRWKLKSPPKVVDTRTRLVFAWKKTLVDNYVVWLEQYQVYEEYVFVSQQDFAFGFYGRPGEQWIETSRTVCDYYV
jgi:alkylated DNA repair dioxygenase AlkB